MMIFITPTIFKGHLEVARKIFKSNEDEPLAVEESRDELFDRLHGFEETQVISGVDRTPASAPAAPFLSPVEKSFKENK